MHYLIGIGNTLRGDDALGPLVVEQVRQQLERDSGGHEVRLISVVAPTPELAAEIAGADRVVFVDAASNGTIGEVVCQQLGDDFSNPELASQQLMVRHGLDAAMVWNLSRNLYGTRGTAWLVTTRGVSFDFADSQLSPEVSACFGSLFARVMELLELTARSVSRTR